MSKSRSIELPTLEAPQREDGTIQDEQGDWEEYHKELLSVAQSLVLHYSLVQTRQRHIQQLFPNILTHPPVAPHNRPRAEKTTKSLLEPFTEPVLPLPIPEYHDPAAEPKKGKGKSDKQDEETNVKAPAHETRCVARATVKIGPMVYPDTELWVGRFVDPKTYIKPERPRPPKEKKPPVPRPRPAVAKPTAVAQARPLYRPDLQQRPLVPASATGIRPLIRPPPARPHAPPSIPLARPPARPPPSSPINASLIHHVNEAAARFPRLQLIIQKAARGEAAKEELAILGRVVAKIGKSEPILATDIYNTPNPATRPPASAPQPPAPAVPTRPAPAAAKPSALPSDSDSELSDEEPDMTGPEQVGGGPMDGHTFARRTSLPAWTTARPVAALGPDARPTLPRPPLPFGGSRPPLAPNTYQSAVSSQPPPRPVSVWPAVPRFLLLAFKDYQREKVMIPLGLHSYISRKGGDYVTSPAPIIPPAPTSPSLAKTRASRTSETVKPIEPVQVAGIKPSNTAPEGSVFISFFTADAWKEMDWETVEKALPWNVARSEANTTPPLPNIAIADLLSEAEPVQAVTVTLEGLDDAAWKVMKSVMEEAERADIKERQTSLDEYRTLRKERFASLVRRVPSRRFLQTRIHAVDPAITDAFADKYALRPYRMSNTAHTEDFIDKPPSPPPKKRKVLEPEVTFEMPVSFDELDEWVEEGAHLVGSKRARGRGRGGARARGIARGRGGKVDGRSTRVFVTPCRVGFPCEGCGTMGTKKNKVWRRGPGGRGTLCNSCGDAYNAGTLPPLKAPEAAALRRAVQGLDNDEAEDDGQEEEDDAEEVKQELVESEAMQADNVEPFVPSASAVETPRNA